VGQRRDRHGLADEGVVAAQAGEHHRWGPHEAAVAGAVVGTARKVSAAACSSSPAPDAADRTARVCTPMSPGPSWYQPRERLAYLGARSLPLRLCKWPSGCRRSTHQAPSHLGLSPTRLSPADVLVETATTDEARSGLDLAGQQGHEPGKTAHGPGHPHRAIT